MLAAGPDGAPLLVLHSKAAQKAVAIQLPNQNAEEQSAKVRRMSGLASHGHPCWRAGCGNASLPGTPCAVCLLKEPW